MNNSPWFSCRTVRTPGLVFSIAVPLLALLLASSVNAQNTTWTVKVDVSRGNEKPTYSVSPPQTATNDCGEPNPNPTEIVYICPGDKIVWDLLTGGGQGSLAVYHPAPFLKGDSGHKVQRFRASEGHPKGGTSDTDEPEGEHEYCVAVFDKRTTGSSQLYIHDPKVIVGKAPPITMLEDVYNSCSKLASSLTDETKGREAKQVCKIAEEKLKELLPPKEVASTAPHTARSSPIGPSSHVTTP